jgi:MoaA/NifB/PqqE/SkfB family radical SAM enzyme
MGFPKPWPTHWPDPADYPEIPIDPDNFPLPDEPLPDEREIEQGDVEPVPEYHRQFYAVTWAVNHACNLKCTHCYDVVPYRRHDLSTEDALTLIDRLSTAGVTFIAFSGGEAFLRKDLFVLMDYCKQRNIGFGARSNGTRITPPVAQRLKTLGISVVGVSFDGATADTHNAVRGVGAFDDAIAGLKALRVEGVRAQMEVVLSKQNAHESLDFIELGKSVGASEVNFSTMSPQGRAQQRASDALDHPTWLKLVSTLREASKTSTIPVTPNCALIGLCVANIEPHITCDGWMTPCYLSSEKLFNVLEVPSEHVRSHLMQTRSKYLNVCGREAWITAPKRVR